MPASRKDFIGRSLKGTDPVQARRLHLLADPCLGQHPPAPHQNHLREGETLAHRGDLRGQRRRIRRVAGERLHRYRTSVPVTQQAELDLQLAPLAVPGITAFGQRTRSSLHPHRSQVTEDQAALIEVPLGQTPLDPLLALQEPVHGAIEVVLVELWIEDLAKGAHRRGLDQPPCRGELRGGLQDASHDHGQHLVPSR